MKKWNVVIRCELTKNLRVETVVAEDAFAAAQYCRPLIQSGPFSVVEVGEFNDCSSCSCDGNCHSKAKEPIEEPPMEEAVIEEAVIEEMEDSESAEVVVDDGVMETVTTTSVVVEEAPPRKSPRKSPRK